MSQKTSLNFFGKITAVTLLSAAAVFSLNVKDAKAETSSQTINVSSSDIEDRGAYRAIQAALNQAEEEATSQTPYRVVVAPGNYELNSTLRVYSNTDLVLDGVTLQESKEPESGTNMIKVGDSYDQNSGYYYKNITVEGGTLDKNGSNATALKAVHVENFTLKNMTIENTYNSHLMETAGVNGLNINSCTFKNQTIDLSNNSDIENSYEAIQLDILIPEHLQGYLPEALQTKNVQITNCTFDSVPRGVGSHTTFLNVPFDNIQIKNNTFTNMGSCAIEGMNWINCTISGNTISNSPRGIALYSVRDFNTYLPSSASKEGGVASSYSDKYKKPSTKQNITISGNIISSSGKDKYAPYDPLGILLEGVNLKKSVTNPNHGDVVPRGNYFISGATITRNTITSDSHGIKLIDAKNSTISSNKITCTAKKGSNLHGILLRKESTSNKINNNTIKNAPSNGIYVNTKSSASSINSNTIKSAGKYGIDVEGASASTISSNKISNSKSNGIFIFNGSNVKKTIKSNTIKSVGKYGIGVDTKAKVTTIEKNNISSPKASGIYVRNKSVVKNIKSNTISSPKKYGIGLDHATVNLIQSNKITKPSQNGINVYVSTAKKIYSNKISKGKKFGIGIYSCKHKPKLKKNSIKSCKKGKIEK